MAWKNVQYENGKMRTSSGGSGGSSAFADLEDVDLSDLQDGQVPKYNSSTQKWENADIDIYPLSIVDGKLCITYVGGT